MSTIVSLLITHKWVNNHQWVIRERERERLDEEMRFTTHHIPRGLLNTHVLYVILLL